MHNIRKNFFCAGRTKNELYLMHAQDDDLQNVSAKVLGTHEAKKWALRNGTSCSTMQMN